MLIIFVSTPLFSIQIELYKIRSAYFDRKHKSGLYSKNKSLIIPTEDLRPTSFGPNDIDNIDEVAEINFELLSKKAKSKKMIKII
jgi:hypothetical protein